MLKTKNLWDSLPSELQLLIIRKSDILTQFLWSLHNGTKHEFDRGLTVANKEQIWRTAFEIDWDGDLNLLDTIILSFINHKSGSLLIRSRSMYARWKELNKYRGNLCEKLHIALHNHWDDEIQAGLKHLTKEEYLELLIKGPHVDYFLKFANEGHLEGPDQTKNWQSFMDNVARVGDLKTLRLLHETRSEGCTTQALEWAASNGHLDVVKFLHENRSEGCGVAAMDQAASGGHLEVVKFLHYNRPEGCTVRAMDGAAMNGHLDVVQFLHSNRSEGCTTTAIDSAAWEGYFDVIRFLNESRTEGWTTKALVRSMAYGRINIFKYLHGPKGNCSEKCTTEIIDDLPHEHTPLETYKFLIDYCQGGYTSEALSSTCHAAGHELMDYVEKVEFLHGPVCSEHCWSEGLEFGIEESNKPMADYFLNHCPKTWTKEALRSACFGELDFVKSLHGSYCTDRCSSAHFTVAIRQGHLEILKYLYHNCIKRISRRAKSYARKRADDSIKEFLGSVGALKYSEDDMDDLSSDEEWSSSSEDSSEDDMDEEGRSSDEDNSDSDSDSYSS
jgi:hypothetical protein